MDLYIREVMADSPLLCWRLSESAATPSTGTPAADCSGNGRVGTHINGPAYGLRSLLEDGTGRSVSYNGANQYTSIASASWMATERASVEIRIAVTAANLTGTHFIASRWFGATGTKQWLFTLNGGKVQVSIGLSNGTEITATGATTLTAADHTLAWSFDGTALTIYVDGVLDGTTTTGMPLSLAAAVTPIEIARAAGALYSAIQVAEFSIMGEALPAGRFAVRHAAAVAAFRVLGMSSGAEWPSPTLGGAATLADLVEGVGQLKLLTILGDDTTPGTEVVGGSYAPVPIDWPLVTPAGDAYRTGFTKIPNMPACHVVGWEGWDAAGTTRHTYGLVEPFVAVASAFSDTISTAPNVSPVADGDRIVIDAGTVPEGLSAGVVYHVRDAALRSFKLAATAGGDALEIPADRMGVHIGIVREVLVGDPFYLAEITMSGDASPP